MFLGRHERNSKTGFAFLGAACGLTLATSSALAQQPLTQSQQAEQAQIPPTSDPTSGHVEAAREAYKMGSRHMNEGEHMIALTYFQTSQQLDPDPKTTLMMASIESGMGHQTRAWKWLLKTLSEQSKLDRDGLDAAQALRKIVELQLGHLHLKVDRSAAVLVDGQPLEKETIGEAKTAKVRWLAGTSTSSRAVVLPDKEFDILLDAGFHRIEVFTDGFYLEKHERSVRAGETIAIDVRLARTFWRKASGVLMITGAGGLVVGTGLLLGATVNKSNALQYCSRDWNCLPAGKEFVATSKVAADAATIVIPTSLAIGGTGLIYWLATFRPGHAEEQRSSANIIYPTVMVGRHESMFSISGSF